MPNTREKLTRLLCHANSKATEAEAFEDATYAEQLGIQADHLIANGVTIQDDHHWATEQAYKNGYADGVKEFAEKVFKLFPADKDFTTISRFAIKHILIGAVGAEAPKGE